VCVVDDGVDTSVVAVFVLLLLLLLLTDVVVGAEVEVLEVEAWG
jgi:hypothetical protein